MIYPCYQFNEKLMAIPILLAVLWPVVLLLFLWGISTPYSLIVQGNRVKPCCSAACGVPNQRNPLLLNDA